MLTLLSKLLQNCVIEDTRHQMTLVYDITIFCFIVAYVEGREEGESGASHQPMTQVITRKLGWTQ